MGHKQKELNHAPHTKPLERAHIFRAVWFVVFRVKRVVNDFLCPHFVSFDLAGEDTVMRDTPLTLFSRVVNFMRLAIGCRTESAKEYVNAVA